MSDEKWLIGGLIFLCFIVAAGIISAGESARNEEAKRIERQCYLVGRVEIDGVLFGCGVMRQPQTSTEKIKWN